MKQRIGILAATLLALAGPAAAQGTDPVAGSLTLEVLEEGSEEWRPVEAATGSEEAACYVNLTGSNGGTRAISVGSGQVRTYIGVWKKFDFRHFANAGSRFSRTARVDLACNARRRYRLYLAQYNTAQFSNGSTAGHTKVADHMFYYPGSNSFTTSVDVKLGDVNRFFR